MPEAKHLKHQAGFSLLELMVAVSLLSLVVIPLLLSQGDAMRNAARLEERVLAAMVAENLLNEATALEAKSKKPSAARARKELCNLPIVSSDKWNAATMPRLS